MTSWKSNWRPIDVVLRPCSDLSTNKSLNLNICYIAVGRRDIVNALKLLDVAWYEQDKFHAQFGSVQNVL